MNEVRLSESPGPERDSRRPLIRMPDEVAAVPVLNRRGWGVKRFATEFGACPKTVRAWIKAGGWRVYERAARARSWMVWTAGSRPSSSSTAATPTSCARN